MQTLTGILILTLGIITLKTESKQPSGFQSGLILFLGLLGFIVGISQIVAGLMPIINCIK